MNFRRIVWVVVGLMGLVSCKDDAEKPVKITDITPKAGIAGMQVKIIGQGFSKDPANTLIFFNGIEAQILSITPKEIVVEVPENGTSGMITATINEEELEGTAFHYYDVFILVNENLEDNNTAIKVWKNGVFEIITDGSEPVKGWALAVAGNDIYVAGYLQNSVSIKPLYWENSVVHRLPIEGDFGLANGIEVIGTDVYVSGNDWYDRGSHMAKYWKNSVPTAITKTNYFTYSNTLLVKDRDVYVGGHFTNDTGGTTQLATYWKNGVEAPLSGDALNASITDMAFDGTDIYALGRTEDGINLNYWKNGQAVSITHDVHSFGSSISVSGDDVYIAGGQVPPPASPLIATLWHNGTALSIIEDDDFTSTYATKVIIKDGNVIIMGYATQDGQPDRTFLKINEYLQLLPIATPLYANDFVVR